MSPGASAAAGIVGMLFDRTRRALGATDEAEASLLEDSLSAAGKRANPTDHVDLLCSI